MNSNEIWRDISGYKGYYQVSNKGRVRSINREFINILGRKCYAKGRVLKSRDDSYGYEYVVLTMTRKKRYTVKVHRLVAKEFLVKSNNRDHVNHINGNKKDNRSCNLEWMTNAENSRHAGKMGLMPRGSSHIKSKINETTARKIKKMLSDMSIIGVSKKLNVSKYIVQDIKRNRTWRHV